jgi:hypothetical protein
LAEHRENSIHDQQENKRTPVINLMPRRRTMLCIFSGKILMDHIAMYCPLCNVSLVGNVEEHLANILFWNQHTVEEELALVCHRPLGVPGQRGRTNKRSFICSLKVN